MFLWKQGAAVNTAAPSKALWASTHASSLIRAASSQASPTGTLGPLEQQECDQQVWHQPGLHVVPMPKLSPVMETGRLVKWLKSPGEKVELVCWLWGCACTRVEAHGHKVCTMETSQVEGLPLKGCFSASRPVQYDVLFEVDTDQLTEEVFKVGSFAGTVRMLVEAHEEGWLARQLVQEDEKQPVQVSVDNCSGQMLWQDRRDKPTLNRERQ